jgi:tyrosine-protein phosphatase SIW14
MLIATLAGALGAEEAIRVRPAAWAQPVLGTALKNLHQVSPEIYRSAQPSAADLKLLCEKLGVRSVLTLRDYHDDGDEAKGLPLALYRVEMDADEVEPEKVAMALRLLREAPKPVLIHCWHGADRTGLVVAAWRISTQGWTPDAAIDELEHGGFGFHFSWFPGIVAWLRSSAPVPPERRP